MATTGVPFSVMVPVPTSGAGLTAVAAASVIVSAGSPISSTRAGMRTMNEVAPAGTSTLAPATGAKVAPPSKETSAAPVSRPSVAVPDAGVSVTVVGVVLALVSVTAKSRLPPSGAVGLDTLATRGRSSSVPPVPPPLSRMPPIPRPSAMPAFTGALSVTLKVSSPS